MDWAFGGGRRTVWLVGFVLFSAGLTIAAAADSVSASCTSDFGALPPRDSEQVAAAKTEYFRSLAACEAARHDLPAHLAIAVMEVESGFNPQADGGDGEVGLMQIMPPTARLLGFKGTRDDLRQPATNIRLGVRYLAQAHELAQGDVCTAVMKYRAGHKQTRFSVRSVEYCKRIRDILKREGIAFEGQIPEPEFGFGTGGVAAGAKQGLSKGETCIRRILVPGPRYMSCAAYRQRGVANSVFTRRAQMFR